MVNLAFVCLSLVSLALYVARISKDVIGRPVFIVDEHRSALNQRLPSVRQPHTRTPTGQL